jgi:prevent-host-death family protein
MKRWSAEDAQSRFDELLDACQDEGPQLVTRDGVVTAALIPLTKTARPTLKELLLADEPRFELDIPSRRGCAEE